MSEYRTERDSLGEVRVPAGALYGAQTQRALENFPISGIRFPRVFLRALGLVKWAAAVVNGELGLLSPQVVAAIEQACEEMIDGRLDEHFPLDIFQTGSGTSTNMNANEVIAARAEQLLAQSGARPSPIHPNDHVNMCQSSNDVIPTAIHVSAVLLVEEALLPSLRRLEEALARRAAELAGVVKTGRTHLMDAVPIRFGQEIQGWAAQVRDGRERIQACLPALCRLAIGGTAVGTGLNAHPEFGKGVAARLAARTGHPFAEAPDHFAAQSSMDAAADLSSRLKALASALLKIANDLRWMNSGPVAGLGEISLAALQPGSSIMPGKVNPVVCEAVIMVCVQVTANDLAVALANGLGNFQLNTLLPVLAHNLLQSISILANAVRLLADKAVASFTVNTERIKELVEKNPILATALNPVIGYDRAAAVAKRAYAEARPVKEVARQMTGIGPEELDRLLDPTAMTGGGILAEKKPERP